MDRPQFWCTVFLIWIATATPIFAQYRVTSFGPEILPDVERIHDFSETKAGLFWLTSAAGLTRFDGNRATLLPIFDEQRTVQLNHYIQSPAFEASDGRLWLTSFAALHVFDPHTEKFTSVQVQEGKQLHTENYRLITTRNNGSTGLLKAGNLLWEYNFKNGSYEVISTPTAAIFFAYDSLEQVMLGTPWGSTLELFSIQSGKRKLAQQEIEVPHVVMSLQSDQRGTFWLGTDRGLGILKKVAGQWEYTLKAPATSVRAVAINTDGSVWFTAAGKGLYRFDPQTNSLTDSISSDQGLLSNDPRNIDVDNSGRIWVSHYGKGMNVIYPPLSFFSRIPLPGGRQAFDLFSTGDGQIWATTQDYKLLVSVPNKASATGSFQNYRLPDGVRLVKGKFSSGDNELWVIAKNFLGKHSTGLPFRWYTRNGEPLTESFPLDSNTVATITESGIRETTLLKDSITTQPLFPFPATENLAYTGIYPLSEKEFLVGFQAREIWRCTYRNEEVNIAGQYPVSGNVNAALRQGSRIFLATDDGLQELLKDTIVRRLPHPEHDQVLGVNALMADRMGYLWLGTQQGLYRYDPNTGSSLRYGTADGLESTYFTKTSPVTLADGSLCFNTRGGLISFHPDSVNINPVPAQPYISEIWVNGIKQPEAARGLGLRSLTRNYQQNSLAFRLSSVGFPHGEESIEYQLIEYDLLPLRAARDEVIRYRQLPPGSYQLRLIARDHRGLIAGSTNIAVTIKPPVWKTAWFITLCILATMLFAVGIYALLLRRERNRQTAIRKRQEAIAAERDRIAGEVHDDLGGQLSSIMFLSEELLLTEAAPGMEHELGRINELSQRSLQNVRDIIFALDNRKATLSDLTEQLREAGREFFADHKISYAFTENIAREQSPLNSRQKRNLTSIVKEAWHNIVKYAAADHVFVSVTATDQSVTLDIRDDGKGFDPAQHTSGTGGYGLSNMEKKTLEIGGKFHLSSRPGQGTHIQLSIPLSPTPKP